MEPTSKNYPKESHRCLAGCGKAITWQFAICASCEKKYGSSSLGWPQWLRFLWKSTLQERRQNAKIRAHEVHLDFEEPFASDDFSNNFDNDN